MAEWRSNIWRACFSLLTHHIGGCLGGFSVGPLWIMLPWTLRYKFLYELTLSVLGRYLGDTWNFWVIWWLLNFLRNGQAVLHSSLTWLQPHQQHTGSSLAAPWPTLVLVFDSGHPRGVMWYLTVWLTFPWCQTTLSIISWAYWPSVHLGRSVCSNFLTFGKMGGFSLLSCNSSLHIAGPRPFSVI